MIIKALLDIIYGLFNVLTLPINIPSLPDGVTSLLNTLLDYVSTGLSILAAYCDLDYLLLLLGLVISVEIALNLYHLVMYLIKKIPFFGVH